jgi:Domain of unknown function (DUF4190)
MFCKKCGAEINGDGVACSKCGCAVAGTQQKKTSALAIASFILGFLFGPAGIVLGIIALDKISVNTNSLKGKGLAIAGIAIGAVFSALFLLMFIVGISAYNNLARKAAVYNGPPKFLELKLVSSDSGKLQAAIAGNIPDGYELKYTLEGNEPLLLEKESLLTGESIASASVTFNNQGGFNEPMVSGRLNPEGAKKFAEITKANIGGKIAILVDGQVQSAPIVREPILNGEFVISGVFSLEEAHALAEGLNSYARSKK